MAASAMPSKTLCEQWNGDENGATLETVLNWARVPAPLQTAFLNEIGAEKSEPYRAVTLITEEEALAITANLKLNDQPLGPLQAAKIRLVFAAIWHAGTGGAVGQSTIEAARAVLPDPPAPLSVDMPDVVSMKGNVTQVGTKLIKLISQAEYDRLFKNYAVRCGAEMAEEVEPTRTQLSCYLALVNEQDSIEVDLAVWGPNAHRSERLRAMEGMRWDVNGRIVPLVMYGPASYADWVRCFKVFRACAIMCGHIPPEMLDRYMDRIGTMSNESPDYLWPLIYQVDVHARGEHILRVARRLRAEKEIADAEGKSHPYNPEKPWEEAWKQLTVGEERFWTREWTRPSDQITMKVT